MSKHLKNIDLFGYRISQSFSESGHTHKTLLGGFCSIFLYIFFIFFIALKMIILIQRNDDTINVT